MIFNWLYLFILKNNTTCKFLGLCDSSESRYFAFSQLFIKVIEHTWGGDQKKFLPDYVNWANSDFEKARASNSLYQRFSDTWREQRAYITNAIELLGNHTV